jgi:UPF0271 protein
VSKSHTFGQKLITNHFSNDANIANEDVNMLESTEQVIAQVTTMIHQNKVNSLQGALIDLKADTICIHGDGPNAIEFAKGIYDALKQNNIEIKKYECA